MCIAKFWKPKQCQALPPWQQLQERDPFEYKLRSKEELLKEFESQKDDEIRFQLRYQYFPNAEGSPYAERNRKVGFPEY
jgi:hypothetical protein